MKQKKEHPLVVSLDELIKLTGWDLETCLNVLLIPSDEKKVILDSRKEH